VVAVTMIPRRMRAHQAEAGGPTHVGAAAGLVTPERLPEAVD
jgi:hypothetical protein